jgi:hypothetical protein
MWRIPSRALRRQFLARVIPPEDGVPDFDLPTRRWLLSAEPLRPLFSPVTDRTGLQRIRLTLTAIVTHFFFV